MKILLIIFACLFVVSAHAAETLTASLFFSPEQIQKIEMLSAKTRQPVVTSKEDIHLGAVFYYAPEDWVLWLQGQRWTPVTERDDLRVIDVTPDHVTLLVAMPDGVSTREVTLKPYQTYQLASGLVVEGGVVVPVKDSK